MRCTRKYLALLDDIWVAFLISGQRTDQLRGIALSIITLETRDLLFQYQKIAPDPDVYAFTQHPYHFNKT